MNKNYSVCLFIFFFVNILKTYDGQLDPTFGQNGIVESTFSGIKNAAIYSVSAPGVIFAAGYAQGPFIGSQFAVAGYLNNGTSNPNFGTSGMGLVTTNFGVPFYSSQAQSMAVIPGYPIVVAGFAENGIGKKVFAVACYDGLGGLAIGFNPNHSVPGTATTTIMEDGSSKANAVAYQYHTQSWRDSKIVAAGVTDAGGDTYITLVRYNMDGSLDNSFNSLGQIPGTVLTKLEAAEALSLAIQQDNKIVVVGYTGNDFLVLRYTTSGELDTTFNGTGMVIGNFGGTMDRATSVQVYNGKIIIGGTTNALGYPSFACARFNLDGSLDTSFNASSQNSEQPGMVITNFKTTSNNQLSGIQIQQQTGKILLAGTTEFQPANIDGFALACYLSDGTLDTSFNPNGNPPGTVVTQWPAGQSADAYSLAIQGDSKIVVVGSVNAHSQSFNTTFTLARYLSQ